MAVSRARARESVRTTRALVLRRTEYGEADLVLSIFTEAFGKISALARGARKSTRRFAGSLEAMHTLELRLEERPTSELFAVREARIVAPRMGLTSSLERLEAAGRALSWVRSGAPARTPEPELWEEITTLLDRLAARDSELDPARLLATSGLRILAMLGWGLDFERCVRCGKECPPGQPALIDPGKGGLVCRSCGGARQRLDAARRARLARAARDGDPAALEADDAKVALDLVERVLKAHAGIE
ncbi:MAG TPA: DNA repair protein RecO [Polyangiaceae bacterium]